MLYILFSPAKIKKNPTYANNLRKNFVFSSISSFLDAWLAVFHVVYDD